MKLFYYKIINIGFSCLHHVTQLLFGINIIFIIIDVSAKYYSTDDKDYKIFFYY